jgi:hypothetical protein
MIAAQNYTFTVPAGGAYRLPVGGEFFKLLAATGKVRVDAKWGRIDGMTVGQGLEKSPYDFLTFTDQTGAPNLITVLCAGQYFLDGSLGNVQITSAKNPIIAYPVQTASTVSNFSLQLLAANPARQYLLVQNRDTVGNIWIYLNAVNPSTLTGIKIGPGGAFEMASVVTTAAIYAIGDIANNANVLAVEG